VPGTDLPERLHARRRFERAAARGGESAVAREAARRMAQRLDYVKLSPARVLDAGCGHGEDLALLKRRFPHAHLVGVDSALAPLKSATRARTLLERVLAPFGASTARVVCADIAQLPFQPASFDAVWSNLALPWVEAAGAFRQFHRVLRPGGLLTFTTYGPDSLKELKAAFAAVDSYSHVQRFVDMHDLGDMLVAGGFAAPVMDIDIVTFTYDSLEALAGDLRRSGQTHSNPDRRRVLMGRGAWTRAAQEYEKLRRGGRLPATVELVFGHAWKPERTRVEGVAPIRFHR
jgi:malonyl-CoA O-methyltransferase